MGKGMGRRLFLYNTVCEIVLYNYDGDSIKLLNECEEKAEAVQNMLNFYDSNSELARLNSCYEPGKPYRVSGELFELLIFLDKFSKSCDGAYDATVGPLMKLWDFTASSPSLPSEERLEACRERVGYDKISYRHNEQTVCFPREGMSLDAGGAGKGYAVGVIAECLKNAGVKSATVNFGGNLYLMGEHLEDGETERPWRVAIQRPWAERGEAIGWLELKNLAIATSAGYERHFEMEGQTYQHILNPRTGYPVKSEILSVSIVSKMPVLTDLMSTAFYVLGMEEGERLVKYWQQETEVEYVAVTKNKIIISDGISGKFQKIPM